MPMTRRPSTPRPTFARFLDSVQLERFAKDVYARLPAQIVTPDDVSSAISAAIADLKRGEYSTSNVTTKRTFDADATTLDEIADVLGTLIADLQDAGLLG